MSQSQKDRDKKRARERELLICEVISSEKVYVTSLKVLRECYIIPLRQKSKKSRWISQKEVSTLFANAETICNFHEEFYRELEAKKTFLCEVFAQYSDFFKIYTSYCNQYEKSVKCFHNLKNNHKFQHFLRETRKIPKTDRLDLMSFLIMPVQRIPRYNLLLSSLQDLTPENHPDREYLDEAASKVLHICNYVDDAKKKVENLHRMMSIHQDVKKKSFQLVDPKRVFLHDGELSMKRPQQKKTKTYRFVLFNDIIIWTSLGGKYKGVRNLGDLEIHYVKGEEFTFDLMSEEIGQKTLRLTATSEEDMQLWATNIHEARIEYLTKFDQRRSIQVNHRPLSVPVVNTPLQRELQHRPQKVKRSSTSPLNSIEPVVVAGEDLFTRTPRTRSLSTPAGEWTAPEIGRQPSISESTTTRRSSISESERSGSEFTPYHDRTWSGCSDDSTATDITDTIDGPIPTGPDGMPVNNKVMRRISLMHMKRGVNLLQQFRQENKYHAQELLDLFHKLDIDEKFCQSFIDSNISVSGLARLSTDELRSLIPDVIQRSKLLRYICSELRDPLKALESLARAPPRAFSYSRQRFRQSSFSMSSFTSSVASDDSFDSRDLDYQRHDSNRTVSFSCNDEDEEPSAESERVEANKRKSIMDIPLDDVEEENIPGGDDVLSLKDMFG